MKHIILMFAALWLMSACVDGDRPADDSQTPEQTYSFTAVLGSPQTRLGYEEDSLSHNLKMVWNEGDVIRLYPDPGTDEDGKYYDFIANTGAGTSCTVFVYQGYILNWENWKGKAIYVFPDGDNLEVKDDDEEFLAKAYVQKENDNTEHLRYGEFKPTDDGKKSYTGYWGAILDGANLKMDHRLVFDHKNTLVYKIMLRGFLFDVPNGSQLRMSGDAWPEGEVTCLTLGEENDTIGGKVFLDVGSSYGKEDYEDNVLTAYIIRQTTGDIDGRIKAGGKIKFELLCYDKLDGQVIKRQDGDVNDEHRLNEDGSRNEEYFTNVPWGDEYTWEVEVTEDKVYNAGDYVVADLTDTSKEYSNPVTVAIDLGLPVKWAAFNLGADRPDQYGHYFLWGNSTYEHESYNFNVLASAEPAKDTWVKGNPKYDAAARIWGGGWRMPEYTEMRDLIQYTEITDGKGNCASPDKDLWAIPQDGNNNFKPVPTEFIQKSTDEQGEQVTFLEISSKVNDRYIYMPLAGYVTKVSTARREEWGAYLSSSRNIDKRVHTLSFMMHRNMVRGYTHAYGTGKDCRGFSLRAVKGQDSD